MLTLHFATSGHLSDPCVFVFQFSDVESSVRIQKGFTISWQHICRKLEGLLQSCSKFELFEDVSCVWFKAEKFQIVQQMVKHWRSSSKSQKSKRMKGPWTQSYGQDFDTGKPGKALQDIMQLDFWRIHTCQFDHLQASMADPRYSEAWDQRNIHRASPHIQRICLSALEPSAHLISPHFTSYSGLQLLSTFWTAAWRPDQLHLKDPRGWRWYLRIGHVRTK
jgi:hypothetical protein